MTNRKPVNVIRLKFIPKATLNRHWRILVDRKDLVDWLEEAVNGKVPRHWSDKNHAMVYMEDLESSMYESPVEAEILICANCASAGYHSGGDMGLEPFKVKHDLDYVYWDAVAPESHDAVTPNHIRFKFHREQYEAEIMMALEKNKTLMKKMK